MVTLRTTCFSITNLYILPTLCIISQNKFNVLGFVEVDMLYISRVRG